MSQCKDCGATMSPESYSYGGKTPERCPVADRPRFHTHAIRSRALGREEERARWLAVLPKCVDRCDGTSCTKPATKKERYVFPSGRFCEEHSKGLRGLVDLPWAELVRER